MVFKSLLFEIKSREISGALRFINTVIVSEVWSHLFVPLSFSLLLPHISIIIFFFLQSHTWITYTEHYTIRISCNTYVVYTCGVRLDRGWRLLITWCSCDKSRGTLLEHAFNWHLDNPLTTYSMRLDTRQLGATHLLFTVNPKWSRARSRYHVTRFRVIVALYFDLLKLKLGYV